MNAEVFDYKGYRILVYLVFEDVETDNFTGISISITSNDSFSRRVDLDTTAEKTDHLSLRLPWPETDEGKALAYNEGFKLAMAEIDKRVNGLE